MTRQVVLYREAPGRYVYANGRYSIERQDGQTECSHPHCDPLHRKFWSWTSDGRGAMHWVDYVQWHVWDAEKDDYAGNGPEAHEFPTKRDAVVWLSRWLERETVGVDHAT